MGRKKFRLPSSSNRFPSTERSFHEHMVMGHDHRTLDRRELLDLVRGGEDSEVEFKIRFSNPDKIAAEIVALANSGGGAVIFGVSDSCRIEGIDNPDRVEVELRDICAHDIVPPVYPFLNKVAFNDGRRVLVLEVDDRRAPHTTRDQRYYIRVGAIKREAEPEEIVELFRRHKPASFDQIPWFAVKFDDIDEALVWSYIRALHDGNVKLPTGLPTAMALRDMQLAVEQGDDYVPTLAGALLFGKSKELAQDLPRSRVVATRFSGDSVTDPIVEQVTFFGNLGNLYERTEGFLTRYVELCDQSPARSTPDRGAALRRSAYARRAVLEAVTNALVHRDYSAREEWVRVLVFDRRIEIANPIPKKHPAKHAIETYGVSLPPNPRLKSFFRNEAYGVTTYSGGIPMIRRETLRITRREPKLTVGPGEFRVEIPGV